MRLLGIGAALAASVAVAFPGAARAATFTVDTTADDIDMNPGDGVCAGASGRCALRAAINEANALPGTDFILVGPGLYALAIEGAGEDAGLTGDLDILDDVFIQGDGRGAKVVDGLGLDRVLEVHEGVLADLSGLVVRNGLGAGIVNGGRLSFLDGAVRDSEGPGIDNLGTLLVLEATIEGNVSPLAGGGVRNSGEMTLANAAVRANRTTGDAAGGGVFAALGSLTTIFNTAIEANEAGGPGGGLASETLNVGVSLLASTVAGNTSGGSGGGLSGPAELVNATVSGNTASGACGGVSGVGPVRSSTVVANRALGSAFGGLCGTLELRNTIVALNRGTVEDKGFEANDCAGSVTSAGYNVTSTPCGFAAPGDQDGVDPYLIPLGDYSGPTRTHALAPISPALDAGDNAACPATDQRGIERTDGACDVGAFETTAFDLALGRLWIALRPALNTAGDTVGTVVLDVRKIPERTL